LGSTEKILTVNTTVLSEPDLNQVVNTTVWVQLKKYWAFTTVLLEPELKLTINTTVWAQLKKYWAFTRPFGFKPKTRG